MNTTTTDTITELLGDIARDFGIVHRGSGWWHDLNAWVGENRPALMFEDDMPPTLNASDASQAVADIIADSIRLGDPDLVADARSEMLKDRGLIFEEPTAVLWLECAEGKPDVLVVWLGNLEDQDMTHIGRAKVTA